ncbi:MAG: helix-turn-helix domain-containing protein [Muribaculum sp.]|nr:helix-turn-helix domain-containing protein [Muribaculum sp.]
MEVVQIEKDLFDAMLERMAYLHETVCTLYEKMRDKCKDDWLSLQEVCKILNISERKVRNLQYGGRIGFVKHGKKSCYKADDVYAIAMNRQQYAG